MIQISKRLLEKLTLKEKDTVEGTTLARDQAHHLGLEYDGYGYWEDEKGKRVAQTIKGHLVRLEPNEEPTAKNPQEHPAISPTANLQGKEAPIPGSHPQQQKYTDPYTSIPADWESEATTMERLDPYDLRRKIHPQEQAEIVDTNVMNAFYNASEYSSRHAQASEQLMNEEAIKQSQTWRKKLHMSGDYYNLLHVQTWWQNAGAYSSPKQEKEYNNAQLDKIIQLAGELPKTKAMLPIERGMTLHHTDAEQFLQAFEIGKNAELPYSGFSSDPSRARDFAKATMGQNVGIVLRIHPNKNNEIYGIHLSGVVPDYDTDEEEIIQEFAETSQQYDDEKEIIRIPQSKTRCRGIKKMMSRTDNVSGTFGNPSKEYLKTVYIIDLDEMGPEQQQNESSDDTHRHMVANNPVFEYYMNTCFRQEELPQESQNESTFSAKSFIKETVSQLILEVTPAEQAHHLGLTSKYWGWWQDSSGKVVAKTQDGILVRIEPEEYENNPTAKAGDPSVALQWTNEPNGITELNGIPFTPWTPPTDIEGWKTVEGQLDFDEPEFVIPKETDRSGSWGLKPSAGAVIEEEDGRVWIVEPTNHFGGYEHTFPKGGWEKGLTLQQTAIKEVFEETGLKIEITGFSSDHKGQTSFTRLYKAKRVGGTPDAHGWETQAVKLVPVADLKKYRRKVPKKEYPSASNIMAKKIGNAAGTNIGGFYEGKDGIKRYVKQYKDPDKAETEVLANNFYRDIGIAAPNSNTFVLTGGKVAFYSDIIPGVELNQVKLTPELAHKILEGFVADVMTANYDAVGLEHDNVIVDEQGTPIRIDQGGSFLFRAMESSGRKKEEMLDGIPEWDGLQNPNINPAYARIFKAAGITPQDPSMVKQMAAQIKKIHQLQKKNGGWFKYIRHASPYLSKKDTSRIAQMMDVREKLLIKKIATLMGIETHD